MSELRKDPFLDRWVIIAPERDRPPKVASPPSTPQAPLSKRACPFCPGNEHLTPPEITALRRGGSRPGAPWSVRVFPHREPALRIEGGLEPSTSGLFERLRGLGAHEVVVETPDHDAGWADMSAEDLLAVIRTWQDRQRDLYRDGRLEHVLIYKLHDPGGREGGWRGAVHHAHSHVIGLPVTPRELQDRIQRAIAHHRRTRRCLACDLLDQTLREGERVVAADEHTVVLAPWASRFPFELRVIPRRHRHAFTDVSQDELASLARQLVDTCARLRMALDEPSFDLMLHAAPNPRPLRPHPFPADELPLAWHWHVELVPRILPPDGSTHATGLHVNPTPPEAAAAYLRGLA
jgi:UDPglucose--hexose-1-phosphate uridylyltransferase